MAKQTTQKVSMFTWEGLDKRKKKVSGEIAAANMTAAKAELRAQGVIPQRIRRKKESLFGKKKPKIHSVDVVIFTRQLATMMKAGIPLAQAFDIVGKGLKNPSMSELVMQIRVHVEAGNPLGDALSKYPIQFNDLFCNLVKAGEQSGTLDAMLDRLATYKEKTEALKAKIKKALFYPATVVVIAFAVTIGMLIFVVPQFENVFKSFGAELPMMTQVVLNMSHSMQRWWYVIAAIVGGLAWGISYGMQNSKTFVEKVDRLMLKLPVVGEILQKAAIARFTRTLSTTFAAGLPLVEALNAVSGATGNSLYRDATLRVREEVATGQRIQAAMQGTGLFPNMVLQMVSIGEESGSLEQMLTKVSEFYEREVDDAVDNLSTLLEPLIMVILGVLIGGLIVAMYLPIFKLGSVI